MEVLILREAGVLNRRYLLCFPAPPSPYAAVACGWA